MGRRKNDVRLQYPLHNLVTYALQPACYVVRLWHISRHDQLREGTEVGEHWNVSRLINSVELGLIFEQTGIHFTRISTVA